jgi:hypothetical protein
LPLSKPACGFATKRHGPGNLSSWYDFSERQIALKCGDLKSTPNGAVIFKDSNTAHYVCNQGYKLVGQSKVLNFLIQ